MRKILLLVALFAVVLVTVAEARIKVKGIGTRMNFDAEIVPANLKASYDLMLIKCNKCHTMERTVIAVQTGIAPITGQPFNKQAVRAYGIKMLRKPNSGMNKQE